MSEPPSPPDPAPHAIRGRVASGLAWAAGSLGVVQVLGIAQTMVLARLLTPSDFGLWGMVGLATGTFGIFSNLGIRDGVIQSRHDVQETLDSAFFLNVVRGALLYLVIFLAAPLVEAFFATPGVSTLLRVGGLTVVLGSLHNVGTILFSKHLEYRKAYLWGHFPAVITFFATIGFAWWLRSAWALALAALTVSAAMVPLSYWVHPFRPRFRFHREAMRHLLRFGAYIVSSDPLFWLSNRIDDIVVGRLFGTHWLGAYQLAYGTAILPATHVGQVVTSVLFPVFARLQASPRELRDLYLKTLRHLASTCLPLSGFLCLFAGEVVALLYGPKWADAVPLIVCFSLYGGVRAVSSVVVQIFKATGRTRVFLEIAILNIAAVAFVLFVAARHGPVWIAVLLSAISLPFALYGFELTARLVETDVRRIVRECLPGTIATALAIGVTLAARGTIDGIDAAILRLAAGGLLFAAVHLPALMLLDRRWLPEVLSLVRSLRADSGRASTSKTLSDANVKRGSASR